MEPTPVPRTPVSQRIGAAAAAESKADADAGETVHAHGSDNDGSKHVDVAAHYVRERIRSGDISYHYVATTENIADSLSKNNYYPAFKKFRAAMGVA